MCKICTIKNINNLVNLRHLDCTGCTSLTEIPKELVNLELIDCRNCPYLIEIPKELVNLKILFYEDYGRNLLYLTDVQKKETNHKKYINISEPKYTKTFIKMIKTYRKEYIVQTILNKMLCSDLSISIINFL